MHNQKPQSSSKNPIKKDLGTTLPNSNSNALRIYNTAIHNFGYEYTQSHNRPLFDADKSTPSILSDQSIIGNPDIFQAIPVLKEIFKLGECVDESFVTSDEMLRIFSKLKILQACDGNDPFRYFPYSRERKRLKIEGIEIIQIIGFITNDLQKLSFGKCSKEEIILKLGIEIFRAVGKENSVLELTHLVSYMKEHRKIDLDMTHMLELFDFFLNPNNGILKSKTSLLTFFSRNASKLAKVCTLDFLTQLQLIVNNKRGPKEKVERQPIPSNNTGSTLRPSVPTSAGRDSVIRLYDPNKKITPNVNQNSSMLDRRILDQPILTNIQQHTQQSQNNVNVIRLESQPNEITDLFKLDIAEVFNEIMPKNRGWIMRKSNKKANKWSMVFFEITNDKLMSYKPQTIKKSIPMKNIEIHKCNFLEVISRFETQEQRELKKSHKRSNSQSKNKSKEQIKPSKQKDELLFFILDNRTNKAYLIRSPDNIQIGSLVHFYILKENPNTPQAQALLPFLNNEPEYSGIIEVASAKSKSISKFHSSLKSYTFKKQFLIIKNGFFNVYEMKTKDNLNLIEFETKPLTSYDLMPQTNPYVFTMQRLSDYNPMEYISSKSKQHNLKSIQENDFMQMMTDHRNQHSKLSKGNESSSPHYEDLVIIEEKKKNSSFFSSLFKKFTFSKKKVDQIVLSCDTELKRRQWILTINFFTQLALKQLYKSKASFTKESFLNTNEDYYLKGSIGPEAQEYATKKTPKHQRNKNSISIKTKTTHNPDFVDVYSQEQPETSQKDGKKKDDMGALFPEDIKSDSKKGGLPLMTEPDASHHLDSDEVLLTFTQLNQDNLPLFLMRTSGMGTRALESYEANGVLFSNEIKSMSDIEVWQRFLLFFVHENHNCSEFEIDNKGNIMETTQNISRIEPDIAEEDIMVRPITMSNWTNSAKF